MDQDSHNYRPHNLDGQLLLQQQYINHVNPSISQLDVMQPVNVPGFHNNNAQPVLPLNKPKRRQVKNACVNCQKACKKCDDGRPCQRCLKHNLVDTCRNSVRKERKKGMKRGPYKRKAELTSTSKDEEKDSLLAVFGSQQDSARTPLPVLPQNHIMENVTPSSVITSQSDFMSSFSQVGLGNQFQTSLASQHHYPLVYNRNGNTDIPSPISNHNDINIGITNRPSPQRHFVSHEKEHEFKNMFPLSFHDNRNNNSVSTTLQSNGVMVYGTPTGSPLLSSSSNSINNEINPSWNSLVTDGTFQYVPQHNSHAYP